MTYAGIDVGGARKGFHAVILTGDDVQTGHFHGDNAAARTARWVLAARPSVIGVDAPSRFAAARDARSRACERALRVGGVRVPCFMTPARDRAAGSPFFDWVFAGESLYAEIVLGGGRPFAGPAAPVSRATAREREVHPEVIETFPYGIVCALAGAVTPARPKVAQRRSALAAAGITPTNLTSIDLIDAALCAVAARCHAAGATTAFGDATDGWIVLPISCAGS